MQICPDCAGATDGHCQCGWHVRLVGGVSDWFSTRDRESASVAGYLDNYEKIAEEDLQSTIVPTGLLERSARHTANVLGVLRDRTVLEIGIGQGRLFELLAAAEPERLVGVDIALPYLNGRTNVVRANAENLPWTNEFDVIVATDILEHVLNPGDVILSARRALKTGGRFVLRLPAGESLVPYAQLAGCTYEHVHLRSYTRTTLTRELRDADFRIERVIRSEHRAGPARRWFESGLRRVPGYKPWSQTTGKSRIRRVLYRCCPPRIRNRPLELTVVARKP